MARQRTTKPPAICSTSTTVFIGGPKKYLVCFVTNRLQQLQPLQSWV